MKKLSQRATHLDAIRSVVAESTAREFDTSRGNWADSLGKRGEA